MKNSSESVLVRFDGVTLRVGGQDRFRGIRWEIRDGEQWAVLGANGSGKSTLLRAILGRVPVSRGDIFYGLRDGGGGDAWDYPDGSIGYVSQDEHRALIQSVLAFHQARWSPAEDKPLLLVREVISQRQYDIDTPRQRATHAMLGIGHLLERGIETLSNGEMRKTLIARALASEPKVLVLDAPYAGLDTAARKNLKTLLGRLMREGLAVIMTVQRPEEIPAAVSRLMCVEKHRITAQGVRKSVMKDAAFHRWVQPPACTADFSALTNLFAEKRVSTRGKPLLEIRNASVAYDGAAILSGVDWTVRAGDKWVLRGPNGSGKSTLASLILGDNPQAYANHVRVFGFLRGHGESLWEIKEQIGWIAPELHYHYDAMATCREVVCSGLYDTIGLYQDGSAQEARNVRRWMRALGLQQWAGEFFGALSDGQQRMVLMARALVKEPPLLILDEPCQGLDLAHRNTMLALLDSLARQPAATIIYITHHADEIPPSFTHELLLNKGKVARVS